MHPINDLIFTAISEMSTGEIPEIGCIVVQRLDCNYPDFTDASEKKLDLHPEFLRCASVDEDVP
jgi:hypothetical protein